MEISDFFLSYSTFLLKKEGASVVFFSGNNYKIFIISAAIQTLHSTSACRKVFGKGSSHLFRSVLLLAAPSCS